MLAADRDIIAAPIPDNDLRNPTRLQLWAIKRTRTIVKRSKIDAAFYTWISVGSSYLLSGANAAILWGALLHHNEV